MDQLERIVFLLGAGASKDSFFPVVNDLVNPTYLEFLVKGLNAAVDPNINMPAEAFYICEEFERTNITFEEAIHEAFKRNDLETYNRLLKHYERVLLFAEFFSGSVPVYALRENLLPNSPMSYGYYHYFALAYFLKTAVPNSTIISFNHDLLVEHGLRWTNFNYGLINNRLHPFSDLYELEFESSGITLLKLHGSFNFIYCSACESIVYGKDHIWRMHYGRCRNCSGELQPWYVPPLRKKDYRPFSQFWLHAAKALKQATALFVVGYSFPDYDEESRRLVFENLNPGATVSVVDKYASTVCRKLRALPNEHKWFYEIGFRDYLFLVLDGSKRDDIIRIEKRF